MRLFQSNYLQRSVVLHSSNTHKMSTRYPMEVWIGSERYEICTKAELEAALREIDKVGGERVPLLMFIR